MFRVGLLLCAVSIWVCSVTGLGPTPAPEIITTSIPEMLQFHCVSKDADVDIELDTKLSSSSSICEEGNNCRGGIDQPTESVQAKLKTCPKDKPITIVVTKSLDRKVCGGDGAVYFKLYCLTGIAMETIVNHSVAVRRNSSVGGPTPLPKEEYEVVDLTMSLYKDFLLGSPGNAVMIGTTVYVLIRSPNLIKLRVGKCTAYSLSTSDNLLLLDSSGKYTDANRDGVLLEMFNRNYSSAHGCNASTCFLSKLHAFHFKNSTDVSLECFINICPGACQTSRRRRSSSNLDQHVMRVSMIVYDVADIEGRSSGKAIGIPIFMTTLAALFAFTGYF